MTSRILDTVVCRLSSELIDVIFRQLWFSYTHEVLKPDWLIQQKDRNCPHLHSAVYRYACDKFTVLA